MSTRSSTTAPLTSSQQPSRRYATTEETEDYDIAHKEWTVRHTELVYKEAQIRVTIARKASANRAGHVRDADAAAEDVTQHRTDSTGIQTSLDAARTEMEELAETWNYRRVAYRR
jgi:hypothetical protein